MPRVMRFEAPGSLVHIMARGIDGCQLFGDDNDRTIFIDLLATGLDKTGFLCLAWCLMGNHYHLLLRTNENPMSTLMRPLNGSYARMFNRKNQRRGYLFQDRYKSILCQEQDYAKQLVRYIHLNPIRSGEVSTLTALKMWRWCGHGFLMGVKTNPGSRFQIDGEVLRRFGGEIREARRNYLEYLKEGILVDGLASAGNLDPTGEFETTGAQKGWPTVVGNPDFARKAMENHEIHRRRLHRQADYPAVLHSLHEQICKRCNLDFEQLFERDRKGPRANARTLFCFLARRDHLIPQTPLARYLGVSQTAVAKLQVRGHGLAKPQV